MPKVYKIWADSDCQSAESVDSEQYLRECGVGSWKFDGTPIGDTWQPLEFYIRRPTLKKPDIWQVGRTLAFEPHAAKILSTCLEKAGELFKLPFHGRELTVVNITYVIECLDLTRSEYDQDLPHIIDKYVFYEDRLDYPLFKIPQNTAMTFTVEGLASPDDEFKPLIEKHNLKGLRFDEVWSSE